MNVPRPLEPSVSDPERPHPPPEETVRVGAHGDAHADRTEDLDTAPERIGNYTIRGVLGRGGMGIVFEAEQDAPRRPVALKVIRGGRYVDELTVRLFQRETELLGRLDHPGIAKIYEAGRTAAGDPYFAMELARGETLAQWSTIDDGTPLGRDAIEQRLRVFLRICEAVGFAHRRGVIHRDLKPANIIVGDVDDATGLPTIKVLDFGLAKLAENEDPDATAMTQDGQARGTLAYMSPEQVQGRVGEADLRVDVYALGIVLYEILTGARPYGVGSSMAQAVRAICQDPPRTLRESWRSSGSPSRDLETIVETAMAKDPERRYASVDALADDVLRYLEHQPIKARPASTAYTLRMLVQRNPLASTMVAVALALLVGFGTVMAFLYQESQANLDRALAAETTAAREARSAGRVTDFLVDLFAVADPRGGEGATITASAILERGAAKTRTALASEPYARARLTRALAEAYFGLGFYDASVAMHREAVELESTLDLPADQRFGELLQYAQALRFEGRSGESLAVLDTAQQLLEEAGFASGDSLFARLADQRINTVVDANDIEGARELIARHDATIRAWSPDPSLELGLYVHTLGNLEDLARNPVASLEHFAKARSVFLALDPPDELRAAESLQNNVGQLLTLGRFEEAKAVCVEALEELTRILGEEHPRAINARANLALVTIQSGDRTNGRVELEKTIALWEHTRGRDSPEYDQGIYNLGYFHLEGGDHATAIGYLEQSHRFRSDRYGPDSVAVTYPAFGLATAYRETGRLEESLAMARQSLRIDELVLGPDHEDVAWDLVEVALTLRALGRDAEADETQASADAILEQVRQAREESADE